MPDLLFEIGVEELPALAIDPALAFMKDYAAQSLADLRLSYSNIEALGTPRRLVLLVDDLLSKQSDVTEEMLGPSVAVAFDEQGHLSKAGIGFLKAKGLNEKDIYRKKTDKGEVIAGKKLMPGRSTKEILPSLLIDMMRKIPFKKRMRWDSSGESFARPIRSLLCIFDKEHLSFAFADVASGQQSFGHRFMAPEAFKVTSKQQYLQELKARFVILSSKDRQDMFVADAKDKLKKIDAVFGMDEDLLNIVRNLVEYPFAILGNFEEKYLAIPKEILISEMKSHQKSFAVYDKDGALRPYFICSAGTKPYNEEVFAKGNARVLRARFEDGAFYYAEDQKKSLKEHAKALAHVVFERDLGTIADKSDRILRVALDLAGLFSLPSEDVALLKVAAPLLKADLTTGVVGQFPELEGVMGRIYAGLEKYDQDVGECIESHYWPRFADDHLPKIKTAALLSMADKLDTVVGIIAIGKHPTGNKDPFALRRASIGIVRILLHFGFNIDVEQLIKVSLNSYGDKFTAKANEITASVKDFIIQRARGLLVDDLGKENKDYATNFADSVLATGQENLLDVFARAHTLLAMRNQSQTEFDSLVQAFKRASNIVKKAESSGNLQKMDASLLKYLSAPVEQDLVNSVTQTKSLFEKDINQRVGFDDLRSAYFAIFSQVATIKPKLDAFFDHVMVMVEDDNLRNARLALLSEIKKTADKIADFTHL